jgi:hypothetical protein
MHLENRKNHFVRLWHRHTEFKLLYYYFHALSSVFFSSNYFLFFFILSCYFFVFFFFFIHSIPTLKNFFCTFMFLLFIAVDQSACSLCRCRSYSTLTHISFHRNGNSTSNNNITNQQHNRKKFIRNINRKQGLWGGKLLNFCFFLVESTKIMPRNKNKNIGRTDGRGWLGF